MKQIPQWAVFEEAFESDRARGNPPAEAGVTVTFTAPSGRERRVDAFWDGGRTWRMRFCPDETGEWSWRSECSDASDSGLEGKEGAFQCVPYEGENSLYQHGAVGVSADGRYFAHADGTPFFWLSDTAWSGSLRATPEDWSRHLSTRRQQDFTAIGFFSTHWRLKEMDALGEQAFSGADPISINPGFYQRLDEKVALCNRHGLLAAPIIVLALRDEDAGWALSEPDLTVLVRYIVSRWNAYQLVWVLGGDGDFRGERSERWKRLGRAVFGESHDRLVTMHPCGSNWSADEFWGEPWFDFAGYQSCHDDTTEAIRWHVLGPVGDAWKREPAKPIINLEPNYEDHPAYTSRIPFTDREVRRAVYWSLLMSPTAGVTYGNHNVWPWSSVAEAPDPTGAYGDAIGPWTKGLDTPGVRSMTAMRRFFDSGEWWRLRPAPDLLAAQPGCDEPRAFVVVAATEEGDWAVVYSPMGGRVKLDVGKLQRPLAARWFDPRGAEWRPAGPVAGSEGEYACPDERDWVLDLRPEGSRR